MRKFIPFIAICLFCLNINAQITEAYPTSQRYLFNPYNRDSVYIDSARFCDVNFLYGYNYAWFDGVFYPCNEYQMYPLSYDSTVQVYGVAIPVNINIPMHQGSAYYEDYWGEDNLGPYDDSIRNLYWQTFVDSMHVLWSAFLAPLSPTGERRIYERYIYFVQKTDDPLHPIIITDSVKIQYGINAVGWNRLQLPKLYNCTLQYFYGFRVPTLEVYFDRPHNVNDTFFVGNTSFLIDYGRYAYNRFYTVVRAMTVYMRDLASRLSGPFRSDNGDFRPYQGLNFDCDDPRAWPHIKYPGSIDNSFMDNLWGGPMAIVAPPPCMVPNNLRMTQVGYDSATVEWNIPVGVSHCRLEYGPQGFAPGTGTVVDSLTVGRFLMQGLDENTAYEVRVACWCIYAEEYSDTVSVGFRTAYACPPVPAVTNCAVTDTTIALSWWMPDSADYTDVEYGPAGFAEGEGTSKPHITRNYYGYGTLMMSGLEPRTAYEVRMRNYCSHSDAMSEWFSFDTMTTWTDTTTEGINAILQQQVSLRPNPATTRVQVASPVAMTRIVVTDLQGRTLLELPVTADTAELDTSTWPRGTVIVTVHTAQGKAVKKLALK